ncbi:MAG: glycosyltransferase, partial [Proteobacteria bacterium]|nr:glycosyltransferase [Pseudomonadota bacterium]
ASHLNRKNFYLKNINRFSSILCLANIPPPVHTSVNTTIFFHNSLFLNPLSHPISFKNRIINFFKLNYIKYYNHSDYNWIVQTPYIYKLLRENLKINSEQVLIYPIFKEKSKSSNTKKIINNFVYVSSVVSHKNHKRLVNAFIKAANKADKEITLNLTLNKEDLTENIYPENLKVKFHGTLSRDGVNELYDSCDFAIYPSLVESFGLPLIEAANYGCKVIASDLPYVHEIIVPSITFNPYSEESISHSILKALESDNLPETNILVKNKLNTFIDLIISQNVQK